MRDAEFLHPSHRHAGKGLVAFEQVDVFHPHPRLGERVLRGGDRAGEHPHRIGGAHRDMVDARARFQAILLHRGLARDQEGSRGIAVLAGDARGHHPALAHRLQRGEALERCLRADRFVAGQPFQRGHFAIEPACLPRCGGALVAGEGEFLHRGAADPPLFGDHFGRADLVHFLVAIACIPPARALERAVEAVGLTGKHRRGNGNGVHRLAAPGDNEVLRAAHHALRGKVHRLLRGTTLAIDRDAGHMFGQARDQPRGAADIARLRPDRIAAAPDHIVDQPGIDPGAAHQFADRMRAQIGGMQAGERALLAADRAAHGIDDIGFRHGSVLLQKWCRARSGR